jgi:hypothetical protein
MLLTGERRKDFTDNQRRIIKALGLDNMPDEIHLIHGYVHVVRDIEDVIFFGYDDPEIVAVKISNEMRQTMVIPWDMVAELRWNR